MKYSINACALLVLATSLTACKNEPKMEASSENQESQKTGKVHYSLKADKRKWKTINSDQQDQIKMTQYILENEQPERITELFTVTEMSDVNITPPEYFSQFITELQKRYTNSRIESKIINQKVNSLLGEWWVDGPSPDNNQHEWIRILKKGNDIAVLRYSTMHTDQLEQARKVWESILNNAQF